MAEIWFDVDAALSEVPVNIMPLIDDGDFKTIEGAVAYDAAGMALFWHFVTSAGAYTVTAVTPTTGGNYDWTDQGSAGVYTIEIPASGGASINNDTEGFGWFTGVATGVLPWRGPICGFRAAALNNALIDGNASAQFGLDLSNVALPASGPVPGYGIKESGTAQSASSTNLVGRAAATNDLIRPGNTVWAYGSDQAYWQEAMITAVSGDTWTLTWPVATPTGTITYIVWGTPAVPSALPVAANAVQFAGQTITAAAGVTLPSSVASPTNITAGTITTTTNVTTVNGLAANVITATSIASDAITAAKIADGAIDAATFAAGAITASAIAADAIGASEIAADSVTEIVAGVLTSAMTEAYPTDGSTMTVAQALYLIAQTIGEFSVSGTTVTVKRLDGSTTAATYTLDSSTAPTSRTRAS